MRKLATFATICIICQLATSCSVSRYRPAQSSSVAVLYRDSLRIRDSLVLVSIPAESSSQVTFQTDTSHLETSVARSDAWVDTCGRIHHTLDNKSDSKLPVIVPVIDRARVSDNRQVITRIQTVERELTAWQSFRLKAFWVLLGLVVAWIAWKALRLLINKKFINL